MKKIFIFLGMIIQPFIGMAKELVVAPDVSYSGYPSYVSEFATQMRDTGGPLSPYGSHFGIKAEVRNREFAGVLHFACTTGKNILDYSRTGLAAVSSFRFIKGDELIAEAKKRDIVFDYFGWTEEAQFEGFNAQAQVQFLGLDQYLISVKLINETDQKLSLTPVFRVVKNGKKLILEPGSKPDRLLLNFAVQPILTPGENYLALLPSAGASVRQSKAHGEITLDYDEIQLPPAGEQWLWIICGYAPDHPLEALNTADQAKEKFQGPPAAWQSMLAFKDGLFKALPKPHFSRGEEKYLDLYRMAAAALENALYAPRVNMKYFACVPTKVHYNWFWLWDSGFETLGYSEIDPRMSREVVLSIFQSMQPDGFIAHMMDERAQPITPHSQPPVVGYSLGRIIPRFPNDPAWLDFKKEMYEKGKLFIDWWKRNRDVNHDGLFEYLSQDEAGWDNSPRADYVPKLFFINYYGYLGELIGARVKPLDNVDLNAWMYSYYRAMERWAGDMGQSEEAKAWRAEAIKLAKLVDDVLWDEHRGCWLDTYTWSGTKTYHHYDILTPHIWFPAFTGATMDEKKAREVIEKHLLNPDEFFGKYPIPIVAYNDPHFDYTKTGWTCHIWIVTAYSALEALWRFGYEKEAYELKERLLSMMEDQEPLKAIWETYDPYTGKYRNEYSTGRYASSQFGWSSAFTMEMILDRYQEERFVFADTKSIRGHIRDAEDFATRDSFYRIEAGRAVPMMEMESADAGPLLKAGKVRIRLTDPFQDLSAGEFKVWVKGREFKMELNREYTLNI